MTANDRARVESDPRVPIGIADSSPSSQLIDVDMPIFQGASTAVTSSGAPRAYSAMAFPATPAGPLQIGAGCVLKFGAF